MNGISMEPNEVKNSLDKFYKRLDTIEKKISELEEIAKETIQAETQRRKRV